MVHVVIVAPILVKYAKIVNVNVQQVRHFVVITMDEAVIVSISKHTKIIVAHVIINANLVCSVEMENANAPKVK